MAIQRSETGDGDPDGSAGAAGGRGAGESPESTVVAPPIDPRRGRSRVPAAPRDARGAGGPLPARPPDRQGRDGRGARRARRAGRPRRRDQADASRRTIGAPFITGAIAPLILERLGAIGRTISIDPAGVHLHAPAIGGAEGPALLAAALYTAGLIIGTCLVAHSMRTRARAAHRHLHLQAWQLRQLVPR